MGDYAAKAALRSAEEKRMEMRRGEQAEMFMIHNVCILQIFISPSQARFNGQLKREQGTRRLGVQFSLRLSGKSEELTFTGRERHSVAPASVLTQYQIQTLFPHFKNVNLVGVFNVNKITECYLQCVHFNF